MGTPPAPRCRAQRARYTTAVVPPPSPSPPGIVVDFVQVTQDQDCPGNDVGGAYTGFLSDPPTLQQCLADCFFGPPVAQYAQWFYTDEPGGAATAGMCFCKTALTLGDPMTGVRALPAATPVPER